MTQNQISEMVQSACREALAPLYSQVRELETVYAMRKEEAEPTLTPEEVEDMELERSRARWQKIANQLRKEGKIK